MRAAFASECAADESEERGRSRDIKSNNSSQKSRRRKINCHNDDYDTYLKNMKE